ncbi:hypothetical protein NLI96_g11103 [Meripilus lineatus]|uniref:Protein PBN1 n=1 Tax=Meripilus lineatus TaxID=2056292 RepID=A0AAD5UWM5_9APHY|nr:hypothetical protein NLI96_g11103 [Physisporinus lineatus]
MRTEHFQGFHYTFSTTVSTDHRQGCTLQLHHELPPEVFPDPYELEHDPLLQCSVSSIPNLEYPASLVNHGTDLRCEVLISPDALRSKNVTVRVPLHARYGSPSSENSTLRTFHVPSTRLAWSCPFETETSVPLDPLDRHDVSIDVPVGLLNHTNVVEISTQATVVFTALYLLGVFFKAWKRCNLKA